MAAISKTWNEAQQQSPSEDLERSVTNLFLKFNTGYIGSENYIWPV